MHCYWACLSGGFCRRICHRRWQFLLLLLIITAGQVCWYMYVKILPRSSFICSQVRASACAFFTHIITHSLLYSTCIKPALPALIHCPIVDTWRRRIICFDGGRPSTNQEASDQNQIQAEASSQIRQISILGHQSLWQALARERRGSSRRQAVHHRSRFDSEGQGLAPRSDGDAKQNRDGGFLAQRADAVSPDVGSSPRLGPKRRLSGE